VASPAKAAPVDPHELREVDRELLVDVIASRRPDLDDLGRASMLSRVLAILDTPPDPSAACAASDYWLG
jgi:hypothetical protein